jgi:hypothetical protein
MASLDKTRNTTRTLIIAGFTTPEDLESYKNTIFDPSKMVEFYIIQQSNILSLIFYDSREAAKFYNSFSSDGLDVSYTISKYEFPKKSEECSERNLQSTVVFNFKNIEIKIEDNFFMNFLKQYGEIKSIKSTSNHQKVVEFFDIRDARKAFKEFNGAPFGSGEISCAWAWDMPAGTRVEHIKVTDEFIKSQLHRDTVPTKRIKIEDSTESKSKKNIFIAQFDKFIAENIVEIEKMFR